MVVRGGSPVNGEVSGRVGPIDEKIASKKFLLPLLPLDGGHLAIVLFERTRAWIARLFRRPDPGLVDIKRLIPVSVGVFALIVTFALLLIAADIINPLSLSQ